MKFYLDLHTQNLYIWVPLPLVSKFFMNMCLSFPIYFYSPSTSYSAWIIVDQLTLKIWMEFMLSSVRVCVHVVSSKQLSTATCEWQKEGFYT